MLPMTPPASCTPISATPRALAHTQGCLLTRLILCRACCAERGPNASQNACMDAHAHPAGVDLKDLQPALLIWQADLNLHLQATRAQHGLIQHVLPKGHTSTASRPRRKLHKSVWKIADIHSCRLLSPKLAWRRNHDATMAQIPSAITCFF